MRTMGAKELDYCMEVLELPWTAKNLLDGRSYEELRKGLEKLKTLAKKQRRKLAMKYHPDVTGGDESRMKTINDAADFVDGLCVIERRPTRHVVYYGYWSDFAPTNTATTGSMNFTFRDVDFNFENIRKVFGWEL